VATLYNYTDQVKEDKLGEAYSRNGEKRNAYSYWSESRKVKRTLERPKHRCVSDIKMDV
jgi:hypothetical protein